MVAFVETAVRAAAAVWLLLAVLYTSCGLARAFVRDGTVALRATAAMAIGVWGLTVAFHALIAVRWFVLPAGLAVWSVAAVAVHLAMRSHGGVVGPWRADAASVTRALWSASWSGARPTRGASGPVIATASVVALAAIVGFAARAASVPVLSWDSLTYHAVKAGLWVQGGGPITWSAPGGWSIYRTYLGGGETLLAWAMLPFHADTLCGLADAAIWVGLGLAVYALAEAVDVPPTVRAATAVYVMALPAVARTVGSLYSDNTLALLLVAGLALGLHAVRTRSAPAGALALLAAGTAAGVKIFAAPVAALLAPTLVVVSWFARSGSTRADATAAPGDAMHASPAGIGVPAGRRRPLRDLAWLAGGGAAAVLAVGPWLWRTWRLTGHPLSPLPVRVGPWTLGEPNAAMRWYLARPEIDGAGLREELVALGKTLGLPGLVGPIEPTLGPFTIVPVVLGAIALVVLALRRPRVAAIVAVGVVPLLVSFYGADLRNTRLLWAAVSGRYLIAAVAALVVVAATLPRGRALGVYVGFLLVGAAAHVAVVDLHAWRADDVAVASGAIVIGLVGAGIVAGAGLRFGARGAGAATAALAVMLLAGLHGYRERTHATALERTTVLHEMPRYWVPAVARVDEPERPRTIAVTAGPWQDADNWLVYHFLGRRLQNGFVYVSPLRGGEPITMSRYGDEVAHADFATWRARLAERDVTEVLSLAPQSIELAWLERNPQAFERLAGDGRRWGLYAVRAAAPRDEER